MSENTCCPGVCAGCGGSLGRSYHWALNATYCQRCYHGIVATQRQDARKRFDLALGTLVPATQRSPHHGPAAQPRGHSGQSQNPARIQL
jgi:hypothetical protein